MANAVPAAAAAPVVAPVKAPEATKPAEKKVTCMDSFCGKYNDFADWTFRGLPECCNANSVFSLKTTGTEAEQDGTLKKIAKVVLGILPLLALSVFACVGHAFNWVKDNLCGSVKEETKKQGPPAEEKKAETPEAQKQAVDANAAQPAAAANANAPAAGAGAAPAAAPL